MSGLDNTSYTVRSVTAATTLTNQDSVLLCQPSGGAFTVTLPLVSSVQPGRTYIVRSTGTTNAVTISRSGSDTINGGSTVSLASGSISSAEIYTDGTSWFTLGTSV